MKKTGIASIVLLALASVGSVRVSASPAAPGEDYTQAQVKQLEASAHSPDQYKTLAHYYESRQQYFERQAADAKMEWEQRSKGVSGYAAKYPRPMDSARNQYEHYVAKANEAGALFAKYNRMAEPGVMASNQ